MASVANCPYPLRPYEDIITENLTSVWVTGSTSVSGSQLQVKGVIFSGSGAATGSWTTPAVLLVNITGSTYWIPCMLPV